VEARQGVGGTCVDVSDDVMAATAAIDFLKSIHNLDSWLSRTLSAECTAFTCLLETKLHPALRYSMWCEWHSLYQLPVRISP
jgi:Outer mitochondrial membrane transport complex protein